MRAVLACSALVFGSAAALSGAQADAALATALRVAVRSALPFPEAEQDGTPIDGSADPAWVVRWPADSEAVIEVLANPLNAGNRRRALEAEEEIQKAAMQAQQQSQADYEQALSDFQKTGRTAAIREISLRDDGVAGERYDAESQLTITARAVSGGEEISVPGADLPRLVPTAPDGTTLLRLHAHVYEEPAEPAEPARSRFTAEHAWIVVGEAEASVPLRGSAAAAGFRVAGRGGNTRTPLIIVTLSGNPALLDEVLRKANWAALKTVIGG